MLYLVLQLSYDYYIIAIIDIIFNRFPKLNSRFPKIFFGFPKKEGVPETGTPLYNLYSASLRIPFSTSSSNSFAACVRVKSLKSPGSVEIYLSIPSAFSSASYPPTIA